MATKALNLTGLTDDEWLAARHPYLGASEAPILSGDGYTTGQTYWGLWKEKSGPVPPKHDDLDERLWFGRHQQPIFAAWLRERHKWDIVEANELLYDEDLRMSCTMDFRAADPFTGRKRISLETKNRDRLLYLDRYDPDARGGKGEAWIYDKIQLTQQMMLDDAEHGCIAVLVGGNQMELFEYEREELADIEAGLPDLVSEFWRRVDDGDAPGLLYSDIREWSLDRGAVNQRDEDAEPLELAAEIDPIAKQYITAKAAESAAKALKQDAYAAILQQLEKEPYALSPGHVFTLSATLMPETTQTKREHWRNNLKVMAREGVPAEDPIEE